MPPAKKRKGPRIIGVVGVVLLVCAGLATGLLLLRDSGKPSPDKPVQLFYQALADGDAATALDQLATAPSSTALLTDEVLAQSQKAAAIRSITTTVSSSTKDEAEVVVKYKMGNQEVEQTLTVRKTDNGWKLVTGTAEVDLAGAGTGTLPLAVNDTPLTAGGAVVVFPGTYTLSTTTPLVALSNNTFSVTDLASVQVGTVTATLTAQGDRAVHQALRDSVDACAAQTTLTMSCSVFKPPSTFTDGTPIIDGRVERTLTPQTHAWIDGLTPTLDAEDPAFASVPRGDDDVGVLIVVYGERNGREVSADYDGVFPFSPAWIDLTDPDNVVVTWGYGRPR